MKILLYMQQNTFGLHNVVTSSAHKYLPEAVASNRPLVLQTLQLTYLKVSYSKVFGVVRQVYSAGRDSAAASNEMDCVCSFWGHVIVLHVTSTASSFVMLTVTSCIDAKQRRRRWCTQTELQNTRFIYEFADGFEPWGTQVRINVCACIYRKTAYKLRK
jgi:hypothetical protein